MNSTDFVGHAADAGEVYDAGVGGAAGDDEFWTFGTGHAFELVVV